MTREQLLRLLDEFKRQGGKVAKAPDVPPWYAGHLGRRLCEDKDRRPPEAHGTPRSKWQFWFNKEVQKVRKARKERGA